jgi:hypothetical protein
LAIDFRNAGATLFGIEIRRSVRIIFGRPGIQYPELDSSFSVGGRSAMARWIVAEQVRKSSGLITLVTPARYGELKL